MNERDGIVPSNGVVMLGAATIGEDHGLCSVWWKGSEYSDRQVYELQEQKIEGGEPSAPTKLGVLLLFYITPWAAGFGTLRYFSVLLLVLPQPYICLACVVSVSGDWLVSSRSSLRANCDKQLTNNCQGECFNHGIVRMKKNIYEPSPNIMKPGINKIMNSEFRSSKRVED